MKRTTVLMAGILMLSMSGLGATYGESFAIDMTLHKNGSIFVHDVSITVTEWSESQDGNYTIELVDESDSTIRTHSLNPNFQMSGHTVGSGSNLNGTSSETEKRRVGVWVPYNETAVTIEGYYRDTLVTTISIPEKACTSNDGSCSSYCDGRGIDVDCSCGDGTCQSHESEELCPQDCDPDFLGGEENDTDTSEPDDDETDQPVNPGIGGDDGGSGSLRSYLIGGLALLIGAGLLIWFLREVET